MDYTTAINKALESGQYELADRLTALAEQQSYTPQPTHYYQPPPTQIYIPQPPPPQGYIQQHQPVYEEVDYSPETVTYFREPSWWDKIVFFWEDAASTKNLLIIAAVTGLLAMAQVHGAGFGKFDFLFFQFDASEFPLFKMQLEDGGDAE